MKKKFTFKPGNKNEFGEDIVMYYGGIKVSFEDIAKQIIFMRGNEDRIFPKSEGFEGEDKFIKYIQEVLDTNKIPDKPDYQLPN